MSDIPEAFVTDAIIILTKVEREPYLSKSRDRAAIIARALMTAVKEADEVATKRERERCVSTLHRLHAESINSAGHRQTPQQIYEFARARAYENAAAILKGET